MNALLASTSPSLDVRYPVVRLSRKVVEDFLESHTVPRLNSQGQNTVDDMERSGSSTNQRKNNGFIPDSEVYNSRNMQPVILLEQLKKSQMPTNVSNKASTSKIRSKKAPVGRKRQTRSSRPQFVLPPSKK
ncbi:uncharacterized protein LOC116345782 [Contarinia nasturtii]|uniref:uncharacterized protein LOC116345782 n=1 Tax=Contarinia nasturtii TaxID=265458 RepID=UPI0012D38F57|nr:uncharacterized protein LOC116345782 [Contarinia nasturtii]